MSIHKIKTTAGNSFRARLLRPCNHDDPSWCDPNTCLVPMRKVLQQNAIVQDLCKSQKELVKKYHGRLAFILDLKKLVRELEAALQDCRDKNDLLTEKMERCCYRNPVVCGRWADISRCGCLDCS